MALIRPRLNDYYDLLFTQEEVDFAIPFLDEDIPLYLDPFLLWKSPSLQDNSLHTSLVNSFNHLGSLLKNNKKSDAIDILIKCSECDEVGLGNSKTRHGKPIGKSVAENILSLFEKIPEIHSSGFIHFEEIQLFVDQISSDRISDFACNFLKSFLIDYTLEQCEKYNIPIESTDVVVYNYRKNALEEEETFLPVNPSTKEPIILVPKRWLRRVPWINYQDYLHSYFIENVKSVDGKKIARIPLLNYNRQNYDVVQTYLKIKELSNSDCENDLLFEPIPITSSKRKFSTIESLPTGKTDNADRKYEDNVCQLLASLFYPKLDFAAEQSRTDSGVLIRDLVFYNNRSYDFLKDIYDEYGSQQIVFELKNVKEVSRDHIFQLNRYLNDNFGKFGVMVTRNPPPSRVIKNIIDLWSGQRRCIIILDDTDLEMMCLLYETKQRLPIDVLKKKYIEFMRKCPS